MNRRSKSAERSERPAISNAGAIPIDSNGDLIKALRAQVSMIHQSNQERELRFNNLQGELEKFSLAATANVKNLKEEVSDTKQTLDELKCLMAKQTTFLNSQESYLTKEFKELADAIKSGSSDRESLRSRAFDDEDEERPSHIRSRVDYVNAIKNSKALFPMELKAGNVDSWAEQGFKEIRKAYPSLEDHEIADVLAHRLPKGSVEYALPEVDDSFDLNKFKALAKLVGGIVEPKTNLGVEKERLFHAQIPMVGGRLKSVRGFVAECVEMGVNLSVPASRRKIMVIDKITCFLPLYFQDKIKENLTNNPNMGVWDAVSPILAQNAVGEVDRHLRSIKAPDNYMALQARAVVAETKVEHVEERKKILCLRCGQEGHLPRYCPLHQYSVDMCNYCKKILNLDLYHLETECRNKKKQ